MIQLCEVGPRDGLQNESRFFSVEEKVSFINRAVEAGIKRMETVSFVNPKVVPQMADAEEVMRQLQSREDLDYAGLVLSRSGLERALNTKIDTVHVVLAVSDTFNQKNARRTVEESKSELLKIIQEAKSAGKKVTGVLGTVFGCPFEGEIPVKQTLDISASFLEAGCGKIVLADTTGLANPAQVKKTIVSYRGAFGEAAAPRLHFHNTRGLGIANVLAAYQEGVTEFDSSIGGLGGCPFAPKAVGNVCTEDLVNLFHEMGEDTGINLNKLIETSSWLENLMARPLPGMVYKV